MNIVATVLTVYGIETIFPNEEIFKERVTLQQYLPFTVLKHTPKRPRKVFTTNQLQQYLPFTVLKLS